MLALVVLAALYAVVFAACCAYEAAYARDRVPAHLMRAFGCQVLLAAILLALLAAVEAAWGWTPPFWPFLVVAAVTAAGPGLVVAARRPRKTPR